MKDTELWNLFKVAEEREINPEQVVEFLISSGCQIYIKFVKQILGEMVFEGFKKVDEPTTYLIQSGKNYPLTPDSRDDLVNALSEKKVNVELKVRISWEESGNKNHGYFIIKVKVNLKNSLLIDYEDLRFLPPLPNIGRGRYDTGKASPPKFFSDNFFHELVLRSIKAVKSKSKKTNWLEVKRELKHKCNKGESIHFIAGYNEEGDSVQSIHFKCPDYVEPYKIKESYFKKTLSEYRKII